MITVFQILSILLLLATFTLRVKSETTSFTESDAEEAEEKILKLKHLNESFFWSTEAAPINETLSKFVLNEVLNAKKENVWWENETSFSDYEDLHEDKKSDASPENSVERDLLENVNYFLPDKPTTNSSFHTDFKQELSSSGFKTILFNNHSSTSSIPEFNGKVSSTRTSCAFGERKCTIEPSTELSSKLIESTTPTVTDSLSVVSTAILLKNAAHMSEETPNFPTSTKMFENYVTLTPSVQTSDNLILAEDSEISKDDSLTHGQLSKSNKSKQFVKERDNLNNLTDEVIARTFFKSTETTPEVSIDKISVSSLNVPLFASSILTKLLNLSTSNINFIPVKPLHPSTIAPYVTQKTNNFLESSNFVKELGSEVNHKRPNEFYSTVSSVFPTVSLYNSKFNVPFEDDKMSKEVKFRETIPSLSPSFSVPLPSPETEIVINKKSAFKHPPLLSDLHIDSSFTPYPSLVTSAQKPEIISTIHNGDTTTTSTIRDEEKVQAIPPPRLTNPSCSSLPVCVEITLLDSSWETFCSQKPEFLQFLSKSVSRYTRPIHPYHIVLDTEVCSLSSARRAPQNSPDVTVAFYVTNDAGEYEERMTEICGVILRKWAPSSFKSSVIEVKIYSSESQSTPLPIIPELNSGFVAAVSISAIAGVALCLLCILLVIMKQKLIHGRNSDTTTPTADAYSLDSLSISASFRRRRLRRSARSYLNHAFSDQEFPSHPLTEKNLANCLKSRDLLEEEFKRIPMTMPKLDSIPEGAHVKNRYSNILPKAESRVMLADPSGDPLKCYINANFVKGYEGKPSSYIACQAPLPEGIEDFWRMVWEQQSRVIVMLTMFEENGTSRCAIYFPQSTLISQQPHGDFQVSLLKKDVYEFYTLSTLRLLDLEKNLFRDVVHLWFTCWPDVGVPKDPSSLVTFVQQCRTYINCNSGPTVVHCSTGTGRTGVFLALDVCMREYDESKSIDILQCVSQLRRDRAGAVQNKDQYFLIHEALLEYVSRLANQSQRPSVCN